MTLLGFAAVFSHGLDIMLFYLIGLAYRNGAWSMRKVEEKLKQEPPPGYLAEDLAVKVRKAIDKCKEGWKASDMPKEDRKTFRVLKKDLYATIPNLENLLKAPLVVHLGGGMPFAGLTEVGGAFWEVVAEYLRAYL
jgi:hypothetical protein